MELFPEYKGNLGFKSAQIGLQLTVKNGIFIKLFTLKRSGLNDG